MKYLWTARNLIFIGALAWFASRASVSEASPADTRRTSISLHFKVEPKTKNSVYKKPFWVSKDAYILPSEVRRVKVGRATLADFSAGAPTSKTVDVPQVVLHLSKSGAEKMRKLYASNFAAFAAKGDQRHLVILVDGKRLMQYSPSSQASRHPEKIELIFWDTDLKDLDKLRKTLGTTDKSSNCRHWRRLVFHPASEAFWLVIAMAIVWLACWWPITLVIRRCCSA